MGDLSILLDLISYSTIYLHHHGLIELYFTLYVQHPTVSYDPIQFNYLLFILLLNLFWLLLFASK